jgi:hypothetical protein
MPIMHSENRPAARRPSERRARSVIPTILLIMLAVMIVRDLLVRRWSATAQSRADVTQRSP